MRLVLITLAAAAAGFTVVHAAPLEQEPGQALEPARGNAPPAATVARGRAAVLTDEDGDGLADGLQTQMQGMAANDRVDVIVTFDGPGNAASARAAVGAFDVSRQYHLIRGFAATMTTGQARALSRTPGVFRVEQDALAYASNEAAQRSFGVTRAAVDFGYTGAGVTVCVVDTGLHPHEQFTDEATGTSRIIAFTDFVGGYDGIVRTDAYDDNGHGTHVAITAVGDGTHGPDGLADEAALFRGVAPEAMVMGMKVLSYDGSGPNSGVVAGIEECVDLGADVINLSLGVPGTGDGKSAMSRAVDNAVEAGVFVTLAAGNEGAAPGTVGEPAASKLGFTVCAAAEWGFDPTIHPQYGLWQSKGMYDAPFSNRGPTKDGRIKPDIMGPGVTIISGVSNPSYLFDPLSVILDIPFACGDSCYGVLSGTSMAAPFIAGVGTLMLQANPNLTPAEIGQILDSTAMDWNDIPGKDNEMGAGLVDAHAAIAQAASMVGYAPTDYPINTSGASTVPDDGETVIAIDVDASMVGVPLAVAVVVEGGFVCYDGIGKFCFVGGWEPDLDMQLLDSSMLPFTVPNPYWPYLGTEFIDDPETVSTCPAGNECGVMGRRETVHIVPTEVGTVYLRLWPWAESPNFGVGGDFTYQISHGPIDTVVTVQPPVAVAGSNSPVTDTDKNGSEDVALDGSLSFDPDGGAIVSYSWKEGGVEFSTAASPVVAFGVGDHTVELTVTDDETDVDTDTIIVTVVSGIQPPTADAGGNQIVTDTDGNGSELVNLYGGNSSDPDGLIVDYVWTEGGVEIATGAAPANVAFDLGVHTVTLEVTDDDGAQDTDTMTITVSPPAGADTVHIADIDGAAEGDKGTWRAGASFVAHDAADAGLAGATVFYSWTSRDGGGNSNCLTGGDAGLCPIQWTPFIAKRNADVTFTVDNVTYPTLTYDSAVNHDPDGDSNGTTIVILKP